MESRLYNDETEMLWRQDELEVVFSLMSDNQLLELKGMVEEMIKVKVYSEENFPLSCCGLRHVIHTIMFSFWVRKGKGIRIDMGEIVVCELKESPFWLRYQKYKPIDVGGGGELEEPRYNSPMGKIDVGEYSKEPSPPIKDEGEWI